MAAIIARLREPRYVGLRAVFEPGVGVGAIGPEVNIPLRGQVALTPAGVFVSKGMENIARPHATASESGS
jgi:hypothetical protein